MSEKQQQPKTCTTINNKSQGSVATRFRNDNTLSLILCYKFTAESALKEFVKSIDIWQVIIKKVDCLKRHVHRALYCWEMKNSLGEGKTSTTLQIKYYIKHASLTKKYI